MSALPSSNYDKINNAIVYIAYHTSPPVLNPRWVLGLLSFRKIRLESMLWFRLRYPVAAQETTWLTRAIGPLISWKHKNRPTRRNATPPEKDRATALVNMHKNWRSLCRAVLDMRAAEIRQTDRQTHSSQYFQPSREGGGGGEVTTARDSVVTEAPRDAQWQLKIVFS